MIGGLDRRPGYCTVSLIVLVLLAGSCPEANAGYARFTRSTDTIEVDGDSVFGGGATYEARIMLTASFDDGRIYEEWAYGQEDKTLNLGDTFISGYGFPVNYPRAINHPFSPTLNQWHHLAWVYDGSVERLYWDGSLVASRVSSGPIGNSIWNSPNSTCTVGAHRRDSGTSASFIGLLDTLRISTVARYSGASFEPPDGDLTGDSDTNLLYNFNELPGSTTVIDLSGNGRTGHIGTGFTGATSPEFVPEPASTLALLCGIGGLRAMARVRRRE